MEDGGWTIEELTALGFEPAARIFMLGENLTLAEPDGMISSEGLVYLFVYDDAVLYVGATERTLDERLRGYLIPSQSQTTNMRVRASILDALSAGGEVQVYASDPAPVEMNGLTVEVYPGLEQALIKAIDPPWNLR